jgi:alkanesulfonate monooxygenase SsuD/methylene tetrahydromethanopterin reductase-like flavin-dependent oxidoreductase (luciferase family)
MMLPNLGFVASPSDALGRSDADNYRTMLDTVEANLALGYDAVWSLEHHVGDYSPTPSPLVLLSHVAALHPDVALGTSVVVAPWYHPVRLAGEIAMLASLTDGDLHIGLGRGMAQLEYDAFGLDMNESRDRFREVVDVVRRAFTANSVSCDGTFVHIPREVTIRPDIVSDGRSEGVHLYGALGSVESAEIMARLGIRPIVTTTGEISIAAAKWARWEEVATQQGMRIEGPRPLLTHCIIEDTDELALEAAKVWIPIFRHAQVVHYDLAGTDWASIKGYEAHVEIAKSLRNLVDPANVMAWSQHQLIGSPETVARRMRQYLDLGVTHFVVYSALPQVPRQDYRRWHARLATEVMPLLRGELESVGTHASVGASH